MSYYEALMNDRYDAWHQQMDSDMVEIVRLTELGWHEYRATKSLVRNQPYKWLENNVANHAYEIFETCDVIMFKNEDDMLTFILAVV